MCVMFIFNVYMGRGISKDSKSTNLNILLNVFHCKHNCKSTWLMHGNMQEVHGYG